MKGYPWGWNRPYFKALLPFPEAVFGFCSPWAETPTGKVLRTLRRSYGKGIMGHNPTFHKFRANGCCFKLKGASGVSSQ